MKIKYELDKSLEEDCLTPCPYNKKRELINAKVGSVFCKERCLYFVKNNVEEEYIECSCEDIIKDGE